MWLSWADGWLARCSLTTRGRWEWTHAWHSERKPKESQILLNVLVPRLLLAPRAGECEGGTLGPLLQTGVRG